MSTLLKRLMAPYDNDGDDLTGDDLTGLDRGDVFDASEDDDETAEETPAALTDSDEEEAEEEAEEEPGEEDGEEEDAERDEKGRFKTKAKDEPRIPKSRFDEALNKERDRAAVLERRLQEMEAAQAQIARGADAEQVEAMIQGLEKEHARLVLDGESDKAAEISAQIRRMERQLHISEAQNMTAQAKEQAREEIRLELTVDRLEAEYSVLNPDDEAFDRPLVDFILSQQQALMASDRLSPSKALARAATEVMARFGRPAEAEPAEKGLKKPVEDRKQAQVKKNLDASKKQPASMKEVGMDSDKAGEKALKDVNKMTYEEFDALPESTKAKLRGDFV